VPIEFDALFPPDPVTLVGAETEASTGTPGTDVDAVGSTLVAPTCTVPTEPVALFPIGSAVAVPAMASAAVRTAGAVPSNFRVISCLLLSVAFAG
jgi:hypothetical protein